MGTTSPHLILLARYLASFTTLSVSLACAMVWDVWDGCLCFGGYSPGSSSKFTQCYCLSCFSKIN